MTRIVVDANALFGALLRDSTNRRIMLHGKHALHAPGWLWDEVERNIEMLVDRSGATRPAIRQLMEELRAKLREIDAALIRPHLEAVVEAGIDEADAPYVAAALAVDGAVWSHDKSLADRAPVPVVTTSDLE